MHVLQYLCQTNFYLMCSNNKSMQNYKLMNVTVQSCKTYHSFPLGGMISAIIESTDKNVFSLQPHVCSF